MQFRHLIDIVSPHLRMTAVRHVEHIVEATEDGQERIDRARLEDTKLLRLQLIFGDAIEMVERSHSTPTEVERALDIAAGPIEDAVDFPPIVYILIGNGLNGGSGDDHAIELMLHQQLRILVEHHHVLHGGILRRMALELHEIDLHLQRGVGQQTDEVGLGRYL